MHLLLLLGSENLNVMENVTIREVTAEDYEEVINVRTAYGDRDYLPSMFHQLLQCNKGFAAFVGNKMAAFSFIMQLDGGMTIMPRAGRVHKEYEGTGLYKKLDDYTLALYSQNPDVRYKAIVFIDSNPTLTKKVEEGIYYATLYRKILTFRSTIAKLKADLENRTFCSNVERVDANQLIAIMENKTITGTLFPQNIFASSWTPLRTMKENCEHVFANSGIVLISNKNDEKEVKLTIGHPIRSSIGLSYVIDVYGLRHDDVLDHVLQHLDTVKDYEEDVLQLEVFIEDTDANIRCIHQMACELGFEKYDLAIKEMHCIEKKIG